MSFKPFDKGRLWWTTAQLPFKAYDQSIRKIFRFLAFSSPCFAPDEHLSGKQQDSWRPYEPLAQILVDEMVLRQIPAQ